MTAWDPKWLSSPARSGGPAELRGLYLVQFSTGAVYIGISTVDCASRLRTHGQRWEDIAAVRLMPLDGTSTELRRRERGLVHAAEKNGIVVRNREHALRFEGVSSLDRIVDVEQQADWVEDPAGMNAADDGEPVQLPASQIEAYADRYARLMKRPDHHRLTDALGTYLRHTMPFPARTEASFWSVSCYPTTDKTRIMCVTVNWMETFVLLDRGDDIEAWIFVDRNELPSNPIARRWFLRRRGIRRGYRRHPTGGVHQMHLRVRGHDTLANMLADTALTRAAASFNLDLMRKGTCSQTRSHCAQLADAALSGSQA
ncbi:hypothetical protein EF834_15865 [Rhodococcus spongiicola]|uniref:GIY-YIG domain-containing protein n=1 Tax=Rhodococcus spongiicola TaxID=2487352 RepID=A0A438APK6_9NOCA|nr:hypothetical protein EF834_15865 [Rhodococcus spongiicola]